MERQSKAGKLIIHRLVAKTERLYFGCTGRLSSDDGRRLFVVFGPKRMGIENKREYCTR